MLAAFFFLIQSQEADAKAPAGSDVTFSKLQ